MDIKEIMKLIQGVSDYGLTSFELEEGNMKISLKREKEMIQVQTPVLAAAVPAYGSGAADSAPVGAAADLAGGIASDQVVTSPLVGVFYSASSPDADPFVKVGDRVKKGQVLGIIEAMKLMNEIESEYDGVVEAILVKNEDVVEYGQPLFRIR
ncbi:MAG: acetyl-CoA carboxylase biotin carboxyl carrier protein [Lachnospiraceae bacterium]|nr:acetyl-CoA carboxylase biotin carboxyl carrier protein [Lachnospiraceae bacterium]